MMNTTALNEYDKRSQPRFTKPKLSVFFGDSVLLPLEVNDISTNGMSITVKNEEYTTFVLSDYCVIEFDGERIEISCEVVNIRDLPDGTKRLGLKLHTTDTPLLNKMITKATTCI